MSLESLQSAYAAIGLPAPHHEGCSCAECRACRRSLPNPLRDSQDAPRSLLPEGERLARAREDLEEYRRRVAALEAVLGSEVA
ncbi:MAG: hypothetical protein A4E48_01225 [Methanosaeta sp. PtaU1.Bin060]|nr:MAG: hypothetical protein A4E48_01225 [Methanosaeta sp. PtaU1.Bin060]